MGLSLSTNPRMKGLCNMPLPEYWGEIGAKQKPGWGGIPTLSINTVNFVHFHLIYNLYTTFPDLESPNLHPTNLTPAVYDNQWGPVASNRTASCHTPLCRTSGCHTRPGGPVGSTVYDKPICLSYSFPAARFAIFNEARVSPPCRLFSIGFTSCVFVRIP